MPSDLSFAAPSRLWLLALPLALLAAYLVLQRRRDRYAVRFTELDLLASVAPRRPRWWRHLPAALLLVALTAMTTAFARPEGQVDVPREKATVVVALDVSASMLAEDVAPNRFEAAKAAAKAFVAGLPESFNVGLVSFAGGANVSVEPTQDHDRVVRAIDELALYGGTAIGEAVVASVRAAELVAGSDDASAGTADDEDVPARIVLLSDGANTVGRDLVMAAEVATSAGIPVSTIAYGTQEGVVEVRGQLIPVPVDTASLQELAAATGGNGYTAASGEELAAVYDDIGSSVGTTRERQELTAVVVGLALVAATGAAAASLAWSPRLV